MLFLVEPMFARMVLPLLGGSPAVWQTALFFFQITLLLGYLYAHASSTWLRPRYQAGLHTAVVLLSLLVLPIRIPEGWAAPTDGSPVAWLLALLALTVGLPFFALAATTPLLQSWFARSGQGQRRNPYPLYAASNLGSLLALLAYPFVIEPTLRLGQQNQLWTSGYGVFAGLSLLCAYLAWRAPHAPPAEHWPDAAALSTVDPLTIGRRARWLVLAMVPSSLMLGSTTYLTTTIAPIPVLWVVPLSLYLLTFVLVFSGIPLPQRILARALPLLLVGLSLIINGNVLQPLWLPLAFHLVVLFVAGMVCHGLLARDRPSPAQLTRFYLWLSVGGALGGLFNALVAPVLFSGLFEYPLMLIVLCLVQQPLAVGRTRALQNRILDVGLPLALAALGIGLGTAMHWLSVPIGTPLLLGTLFVPMLVCYSFSRIPLRFGLGLGALLWIGAQGAGSGVRALHDERSFFGVHRVLADTAGEYHILVNGGIIHGAQSLDPARRREPLTYFHPDGPLGQVFAALPDTPQRQVGIVGLGAGSVACYRRAGERWTFYEIDPAVIRIARDPSYFTYLENCSPDAEIDLGDARLNLAKAPDGAYHLLVLDAYTSDAPPLHLLTREALQLYLQKLGPHGVLAFNLTNGYLDLAPVLGALAEDAHLTAFMKADNALGPTELAQMRAASRWVVMAREVSDIVGLADDARWSVLPPSGVAVWHDDFASILSVFRWQLIL